jgi:ketosteroid isomerase-like protein
MSAENVEGMRRTFDAYSRRDREGWLKGCDPELEVVPVGEWPETDTIRGGEAAWDFLMAAEEPWEPGVFELTEVVDGDDKVVARQRRTMRGRASGVEVEYDYWVVLTYRGGKALRVEWFDDRATALEAAGLAP